MALWTDTPDHDGWYEVEWSPGDRSTVYLHVSQVTVWLGQAPETVIVWGTDDTDDPEVIRFGVDGGLYPRCRLTEKPRDTGKGR